MTNRALTRVSAIAVLALAAGAAAVAVGIGNPVRAANVEAMEAPGDACSRLTAQTLDKVEILTATAQPAGVPVGHAALGRGMGPGPVAGLPAFCRVTGRIVPEAGSDIRFEVWMPS